LGIHEEVQEVNLVELAQEVVATMKGEGYRGRTVTVKVRVTDFKT